MLSKIPYTLKKVTVYKEWYRYGTFIHYTKKNGYNTYSYTIKELMQYRSKYYA